MPGARRPAGWKEDSHTPPKVLLSSPVDSKQAISVTPAKRRLSSGQWDNGKLTRRVKVESESDSDDFEWRVTLPGRATRSKDARSTKYQLDHDELDNHTELRGSCPDCSSDDELDNHTGLRGSCLDYPSSDEELDNHTELRGSCLDNPSDDELDNHTELGDSCVDDASDDELDNHGEYGGSCVDDASADELDNHTEWDGSCVDGSSVDELENNLERDSLGDNGVSAEPLKAGSLWNSDPSREQILLLANCRGLDDFEADGGKPNLTARDVLLSAMASVKFIRDLDGTICADDIGIDYAGRLFNLDTDEKTNFYGDFFDMISKFTINLRQGKQMEMGRSKLAAFAEYALGKQMAGLDSREKTIEYERVPATKTLQTCAAVMAKDSSLDIDKLKSALIQCKEAVAELEAVVTVVNTVTQDLIETKSTSLDRWGKLKDMAWLFQVEESALLDEMLQRGIDEFIDATASNLAPYQRFLRRALTLQEDLDEAIKDAQHQ